MKSSSRRRAALAVAFFCGLTSFVCGQLREATTVRDATNVFDAIMASPMNSIPAHMLRDAHGVAIIPNVLKGSFVVGARHGNGVLLVRDDQGGWHAPVFVTLTGGNVGWQVGIQSSDVILVFKTKKSVDGLLSRKFTLGADAAAAAGPVGRQAAAGTDGRLQAEIYSYSRSRGLFAGVSIDGSVIQVNQLANGSYYRAAAPDQPVTIPAEALQLAQTVAAATGNPAGVPVAKTNLELQPPLAQKYSQDKASSVRDELAQSARHLYELVDPNWQAYLALPVEVIRGQGHPSAQALAECRQRFETIRTDPRYSALSKRPEFQATYVLLQQYADALSTPQSPLSLPPPPE